ncbi:MAG: hypothetical protein LBH00_03610, partial [Planctomycetaceae bacterium]|nr:hypothetical protein [Planctomycetaceae bacterium]
MLNVFIQNLKVAVFQWSVTDGKTNEANCLKEHLGELCGKYPALRILTGDAVWFRDVLKLPGCTMAIRCDKTTSSPDGSVETETRYYVSSL